MATELALTPEPDSESASSTLALVMDGYGWYGWLWLVMAGYGQRMRKHGPSTNRRHHRTPVIHGPGSEQQLYCPSPANRFPFLFFLHLFFAQRTRADTMTVVPIRKRGGTSYWP
ncbi:uncharacterized protein BO97DRAFT_87527 [Aspergillus homomorphus CBS 101889]|uniref:Uncharacterized protein n=1 Tax=Aspergillus homomorphus (strain CBS 101889) TaxID=1450537 RepID=A0A395HWF5_ASPHC|nr:hypothetical protein BO97DRAFT_87527 [Aspergillus homomorphus CBS 101889]RAL11859.1 hypothetical protein BO97DRAFT_87527 [Aspergillus homomorphus CBS 101889]